MNLAPNGKPSNLTDAQYKLVRTPEFKAWFGDWENSPKTSSKVVDENGEPLVVYHGSSEKFTVFNKKYRGASTNAKSAKLGFFFTDDKKDAISYSKRSAGGKLFEVFLSIKTPSIVDFNGKNVNTDKELTILLRDYNDGVIALNLKDGFVINNQYIAKEPNQIKLADGSNINFDSTNDDIRFDKGGNVNDQLKKGIAVEHEHDATIKGIASGEISVKDAPEAIASDHLKESPTYYDALAKIEKEFSNGGNVDESTITVIPDEVEYGGRNYIVKKENNEHFIIVDKYTIIAEDEYGKYTYDKGTYFNEEEAIKEASSMNISDVADEDKEKKYDWTVSISHSNYKYLVIFDKEMDGEYEIEENDETYTVDGEIIESYDIKGGDSIKEEKQDEAENIIFSVSYHYSKKYECKKAGYHGRESNYCLVPFKDGYIQLRISDHTPNYENITLSPYREIDTYMAQIPLNEHNEKSYDDFKKKANDRGLGIQSSIDNDGFLNARMVEKIKIYGLLFIIIYYEDDDTYTKFYESNKDFIDSHKFIQGKVDKYRYDMSDSEHEDWNVDNFINEIDEKINQSFVDYKDEEPINFDNEETDEFGGGGGVDKLYYHVSDKDFDKFDLSQTKEIGFHFFDNKNFAKKHFKKGFLYTCKINNGSIIEVPYDAGSWTLSRLAEKGIDADGLRGHITKYPNNIEYLWDAETQKSVREYSYMACNPDEIVIVSKEEIAEEFGGGGGIEKDNLKNKDMKIKEYKSIPASIKKFMPPHQQKIVNSNIEEFQDALETLNELIAKLPKTRETDGKGDKAIAYLHYFYGNQDWYITEQDMEDEQLQAFGLVNLFGEPELGYISIEELKETGKVELDFYWEAKTLGEIKNKDEKETPIEKEVKTAQALNVGDAVKIEVGKDLFFYGKIERLTGDHPNYDKNYAKVSGIGDAVEKSKLIKITEQELMENTKPEKPATSKLEQLLNDVIQNYLKNKNRKNLLDIDTATNLYMNDVVRYDFSKLTTLYEICAKANTKYAIPNLYYYHETPEIFDNLKENIWKYIPESFKKTNPVKKIKFILSPDNEGLKKITSEFVETTGLRPLMSSVHFDEEGVVATDAHQLLFIHGKPEKLGEYCLHTHCFKACETTPKCKTENNGEMKVDNGSGKYPNWKGVIPDTSYVTNYAIHADSLRKFLSTVIKANMLHASSQICTLKYDEGEIGFKADFLLSCIETMQKLGYNELDICISDHLRTVIIVPKGNKGLVARHETDFALLMPMMIMDMNNSAKGNVYFDLNNESVKTFGIENDDVLLNPTVIKEKEVDTLLEETKKVKAEAQKIVDEENARKAVIAEAECKQKEEEQAAIAAEEARKQAETEAVTQKVEAEKNYLQKKIKAFKILLSLAKKKAEKDALSKKIKGYEILLKMK